MSPYDALINELAIEEYNDYENPFSLKVSPVGQRLLAATPEEQVKFVLAAIDWLTNTSAKPAFRSRSVVGDLTPSDVVRAAMLNILRRRLPLTQDDVNTLLTWCLREQFVYAAPQMIKVIEDFLLENKMTFSLQEKIERLILLVKRYESDSQLRKYRFRLQELSDTTTYRASNGERRSVVRCGARRPRGNAD